MSARLLPATLLTVSGALLLVACGSDSDDGSTGGDDGAGASADVPLFATDFQEVCSGATQSRAADYDTSTPHKALYFETYEDDLLDQSHRLPTDWTVAFEENADVYAQVDVVACSVRTADELAQTCEGYEDDDTGAAVTVNWHTATYELTVYAARSGEELGSTTLEADDDACPTLATWEAGETEIDSYASPGDDEVTAFLQPFVRP